MCLTSRAEQRVHPHLLCGHSAGRFDAGLDLLLAHQNEFATIASAWRDADCSHTDRTVVEDLRRGQHHLAGSPREMGPDQERIAEGRSSASSHFAFPTLRWNAQMQRSPRQARLKLPHPLDLRALGARATFVFNAKVFASVPTSASARSRIRVESPHDFRGSHDAPISCANLAGCRFGAERTHAGGNSVRRRTPASIGIEVLARRRCAHTESWCAPVGSGTSVSDVPPQLRSHARPARAICQIAASAALYRGRGECRPCADAHTDDSVGMTMPPDRSQWRLYGYRIRRYGGACGRIHDRRWGGCTQRARKRKAG